MKILNENRVTLRVKRTYDKTHEMADIFVTETVTNYYITIKFWGYALPCVQDWKVSKKDAKRDYKNAIAIIIREATERGNI